MAQDSTKDIARTLSKVADELHQINRRLKEVAEAVEQKQFDDWVSPPIGTAYANNKGCVMMSKLDFETMRAEAEGRIERDDRSEEH